MKDAAEDLEVVWGGSPGNQQADAAGRLNGQVRRGTPGSPDELWDQRQRTTGNERRRMHRLVEEKRVCGRGAKGIALDAPPSHALRAAVDRDANPAALAIPGVTEALRP